MKSHSPPIRGLIEMSLTHWAGRVSSVIFLGGCTLRCPGCTAPHLVGWESRSGMIPLDSVLDAVYRRRRWIEGVVVKGGEPLAHRDTIELLELLRDFGLEIRVDTTGTRPKMLSRIIRDHLVDLVTLEVKAPLTERYHEVTGKAVDLPALFESIEILLSGEVEYEFRTAVRRGVLDEADVGMIARTIRGARRYVLRSPPGQGPGKAELARMVRRAGRHVTHCAVEGRAGEITPLASVGAGSTAVAESEEREGA